MNKFNAMITYEQTFEPREWAGKIPALNFKAHWNVKILPPFGGAIIRFQAETNKGYVSVYLDCYDQLGIMGQPYWEVFDGEDTERFLLEEYEQMMARVEEVLQ